MILQLPSKLDIEAERLSRSLSYYVQESWRVVEPVTPYMNNWHIGLISEYLVALTKLRIQNLIINIPPRHMKSLQACVMWPTWVWIDMPASRWLTGSYSMNLALRDTLKARRILQSDWYQDRFRDRFQLTGDQNEKRRYENDKTGLRMAFGMDTGFVGEGGDFIVVDDSLKPQDADSDIERNKINQTWDESVSTRANDPKTARRLIIGQRLHDDDLPGHVLEKMQNDANAHQYELLCLPARYEANRFFSGIGLADPRTEPGALLWPEHIDDKELKAIEADLGVRAAAGQLQQRPAPIGGAIFLVDWWAGNKNRYDPADMGIYNQSIARWLFWDTALKDKEQNDTTALVVFELLPDYRIFARHVWWKRLQFPQLSSTIEEETVRWMFDEKLRDCVIEDKASGISAIQTLEQGASEEVAQRIKAFNPGSASKSARMRSASMWCERGCVLLPTPHPSVPWLFEFEDMLYKLPAAKIDDPGDAFSMGILYLENLLADGWKARTSRT